MTPFEKLVTLLRFQMETPTPFGLFHIAFMLLTVAVTAFLIWKYRDAEEKTVRRILLVTWALLAVLEIYKQVVFSYNEDIYVPGHMVWRYSWYAFPFQLCSSPLYVLPFAALLKKGHAKDAVIGFLATFSVFGGLSVMFYPNDVFITLCGVNFQTMIHHGSQIAIGIFLAVWNRDRWDFKCFAKGIIPFAILSAIAVVLNEIVHGYLVRGGLVNEQFNMFYISRHYDCTLPVLSSFDHLLPYPVFLLVYLLGFVLVAALIFLAEKGCIRLAQRIRRKTA